MEDNEKQIEEMVRIINKVITNSCPDFNGYRIPESKSLAEELLKYYQQKLPKDSVVDTPTIQCETYSQNDIVVLSGKEYQEYQKFKSFMEYNDWKSVDEIETTLDKCQEILYEMLQQERKETAEKIFAELFYIASIHHSDIANILAWAKDKAKQLDVKI